jgi:hypothetical protein
LEETMMLATVAVQLVDDQVGPVGDGQEAIPRPQVAEWGKDSRRDVKPLPVVGGAT